MTDIRQQLDNIESTAHLAWTELRQLQRQVSDPDAFYRIPVEDRTAGDTLTHNTIAAALETAHRLAQELEAIRLAVLVIEHGANALAARWSPEPKEKTPAQRLFEQATAERREFPF